MRLFLTVAAVTAALASLALAQDIPSPGFGQPGSMAAIMRYGGKMLTDPIFLAVLIVILLIASRFFYWLLIPAGGAIAAIAAFASLNFGGGYSAYAARTGPFWAAAVFLGLGIALLMLLVLRMFGKQE
jgi:hypothetical protein